MPGSTDQPPVEVTRGTLPASASTCDVTAGNATLLLKGTVLTPTKVYLGGQVAVDATGHIACVGCNCATGGETTIRCPDAAISPGLINTHDHIMFTQDLPYTATTVRYTDRQQWRIGLDQLPKIPSDGGATTDQITLTSSNPALTVTSPLVIPDGATTGVVHVTAVSPLTDVTITATLAAPASTATAHVRVLASAEAPAVATLSPTTASIHPGDTVTLTATLDVPAFGDAVVGLAVAPVGAGILPATVTVPDGQLSATFTFMNQLSSGTIVITSTFAPGPASTSTLTVSAAPTTS